MRIPLSITGPWTLGLQDQYRPDSRQKLSVQGTGLSQARGSSLENNPRGDADGGGVGGDVAEDDAHGADFGASADADAAEDLGVGAEIDIVFDDRDRAVGGADGGGVGGDNAEEDAHGADFGPPDDADA